MKSESFTAPLSPVAAWYLHNGWWSTIRQKSASRCSLSAAIVSAVGSSSSLTIKANSSRRSRSSSWYTATSAGTSRRSDSRRETGNGSGPSTASASRRNSSTARKSDSRSRVTVPKIRQKANRNDAWMSGSLGGRICPASLKGAHMKKLVPPLIVTAAPGGPGLAVGRRRIRAGGPFRAERLTSTQPSSRSTSVSRSASTSPSRSPLSAANVPCSRST
jgi:hypothetical protein